MSTDSSSCDSELAEIVAAVRKGCRPEVADALLRMVEDLILQRNTLVDLKDATSRVNIRLRKERDDLRKQVEELTEALEEAERRCWHPSTVALNDIAQRLNGVGAEIHAALVKERDDLRAKLADAKRFHQEAELRHVERVKELETKLAQSEEWGKLLIERWTAEVQHARKLQDKLEADDPTDG